MAELRQKYLAFLIELALGCWPGWSYHVAMHTVLSDLDKDSAFHGSAHANWTFVVCHRIASPVARAPLAKLGPNDWVYTSDRIVVTIEPVYIPSWFSHDSDMYALCAMLHKYIPSVDDEPRRPRKDKSRDHVLLPLSQSHPHHYEAIRAMHESYRRAIAPAEPMATPLSEL